LIIPPAYSHTPDKIVKKRLVEIFTPKGFSVVQTNLPLKTLAVRSGLAKYGRNNITYIDGMGSFYRLVAYYTDIPPQENNWTEPHQKDEEFKDDMVTKLKDHRKTIIP